MAAAKANFCSDIDFCPECGSILPLPGRDDVVTCATCKFQIDVIGKVDMFNTNYL